VLLLGRASRRGVLIMSLSALFGALWAMWATAGIQTLWSALAAFTAGVALWGVHEAAFLGGMLTGPRRAPCPPDAVGWRRFRLAAATLMHHEIALALTALAMAVWLWDAPNPVALWTFVALWAMRLSVKFNIFLGAPNVAEEFLPDDLRYLASYFSPRPINLLFPLSVTIGTVAAGGLLLHAAEVAATPFDMAALAVVGALVALGTLEHWFLVLPIHEAALWRWWMESRDARRRARDETMGSGRTLGGGAGIKATVGYAPTVGR
jgi:putative photosynthetic complex assembly protein 2